MTLTFDLVTQKWVWRVELIKVHLHLKFPSCRWKHFDFRANVKVLARRGRRMSDGGRRAGYDNTSGFLRKRRAKNGYELTKVRVAFGMNCL